MPNSDQNSSPEPSVELDSPMKEEDEELEEVEDEVEVEVEVEVDDEEEKPEDDAEDDGDVEFEEVEEEEEEEAGDEEEVEAEDASKNLESEGHGEDLELVSSTHEMSESNPASLDKEATGSDFVDHDASAKISAVNTKEASADRSPGQDKHISEEKRFSKSLVDEKVITISLEKKMSNEDPEHIKNSYCEAHGSRQSNLSSGGYVGSEKAVAVTSEVQNKELAETDTVRSSPKNGKSDDILEKEVSHALLTTELKMPEASSLSSMHPPQQRPRSASPGTTSENLSKRPAIVCAFYARGWCIKGKSCPFLHHKEESKDGLAEPGRKGDVLDGTGSRGEAERLRMSSSQERPDSSNTESPSKSQFQVQRALVRAYGGESRGSPRFHDDYNTNAGEEFRKVDIPRVGGTLVRDEYKRPFGLGFQLDSMDEKQRASEIFLTRRYLHEEQLQQEMPKREFINDSPFSRGYSLTSSEVPERRYYSGSSSTSSSLYLSNNNHVAHDRRTEDFAFRHHQGSFPLHDSHSSYSSSGSLSSTFNSSYQPIPASSFSAERFDIYKTFDLDKGYHSSRSASLPRSSPPYLSRPVAVTGLLRNTPRDLPAFIRQKMEVLENSWEPSAPFRPSFHYALPSLSSPGSQYDPLLDSIEPRNTGNIALQASERTVNVNFSGHYAEGDPLLHGSQMTEYNMEKTLSSFSQPHEAMPKKSKPEHGLNRQTSLGVTLRDTAIDGGNTSVPKEEKHRVLDHLVESANVNGADRDGDLKYEGDKSRIGKESKAMKFFRTALVDFVKELVKPSWREGHLSKDAHKMVVKKAVEKVLGAFQPHQIPNTAESINQYLSTSRPKLLKLVEGYIEKYAKSEATRVNMSEAAY